MSVTEGLMKTGSWSLKFDADATPWHVRRHMTFFSNVVITAGYSGSLSFDELKAQSLYSGIITRRALRKGEVSGTGLLGYLGTGKATAGAWQSGYETISYPATFAALLTHWFPTYTNGLGLGGAASATSTTVAALQSTLPDMKQAIDTAAAQTGNEYRVNQAGTVDYGTALFSQRNVLLSPDIVHSSVGGWSFWRPADWAPEADVEDYRNTGRVLTEDKSTSGVGAVDWSAAGVVPRMRRWDNSYSLTCIYTNAEKSIKGNTVADATAAAGAMAQNRAAPRFSTSCKVRVPAVTTFVEPGDSLWVYDGLEGIVGTAHIGAPGYDYPALSQRLYSATWPVEEGMGVYLIDGAFLASPNLPQVTDLTPYVQWETNQAASLELGAPVSLTGNSNLTD